MVEGIIKKGSKTKALIKYLNSNDIAVLNHNDIDELAAYALINSGISIILNTGLCMTGKYNSKGTSILIKNGIKLYEVKVSYELFNDGDYVCIRDKDLIINKYNIFTNACTNVNEAYVRKYTELSNTNANKELINFINNTLSYANEEKDKILFETSYPNINIKIKGRDVLIVVRGSFCESDLMALKSYIEFYKPVIIGVDGGADLLINNGYVPDILIGDMDSVSDLGIYRSKEIILHAYKNGYCPCKDRVDKMNVKYKILSMLGTSEDIAMLMAYDMGAEQIVLLGGHKCMYDFMEKGRKGMGSTLLTRIKIGEKLIDFKGISKIFNMNLEANNGSNILNDKYYKGIEERDALCAKM